MTSSSHVTSQIDNYAWLRPAWPAPSSECDWEAVSPKDLAGILRSIEPQPISIDTETTGLRYWAPKFGMQSLAVFIPSTGRLYATSLVGATPVELSSIIHSLAWHKIYAFNLTFDGGVLYGVNNSLSKKLRLPPEQLLASFTGCSQVFFRHCANEGYNVHSLDAAQTHLFGWEDSQKAWLKQALESKGLKKGEMWRLLEHEDTREGFLYYNAMDARSAWLVWEHLSKEVNRVERPGMVGLHEGEFATLIRDCIRQIFIGIDVDRKALRNILINSFKEKARIHSELRSDERIATFVDEWERKKIFEQWQLNVKQSSKLLSDSQIVSEALAGYEVVDEQNTDIIEEEVEADNKTKTSKPGPAILTPEGRLALPSFNISISGKNTFPGFSFNSPSHLTDLLYSHLGKAELAYMKKMGKDEIPRYRIAYDGKQFIVAGTDTGALPTGAAIYPIFGDIGKKLEAAAEADTRYGFAKSYLAATSETKKIHTQLKVHGAATGRCSGGSGGKKKSDLSINVQQFPRSDREFMECFPAPKGHVFLSSDFKSLELVIQAELSGDPVLTKLYASGETHDAHLFHTMKIHPDPLVRAAISARYSTDEAVLKALKKEFGKERGLGKTFGFALSYGSGAENLMLKAAVDGFPISLDEAETSRNLYRDLYKVYYAWCASKEAEWSSRGGWVEDGYGYPIAIASFPADNKGKPVALRDAGSKIVQRTGHYIVLSWLKHIENIKRERDLWDLERPIICDLHDERIVVTPEGRVEECLALHKEALERMNNELNPNIRFEIASEWGSTLYDCKKG
jgi:hypothetical protein